MLLLLESKATSSNDPPPVTNTVEATHTQLRMWQGGLGLFLFAMLRMIFGL